MPFSFLWALPDDWRCKNVLQRSHNASKPITSVASPLAATAQVPSRAVTTRARLGSQAFASVTVDVAQPRGLSGTWSVYDGGQACWKAEIRSNEQQLHKGSHKRRAPNIVRRGDAISRHKGGTAQTFSHGSLELSQQTTAQQAHGTARQLHGAVLTRQISSVDNSSQLLRILKAHEANVNSIHVTAGFRALVRLHQHQKATHHGVNQDDHRAVSSQLLRLAAQHSSSLTASERSYILWAVTEQQLHPWPQWYHVVLGQQVIEQQQVVAVTGSYAASSAPDITNGSNHSSGTSIAPEDVTNDSNHSSSTSTAPADTTNGSSQGSSISTTPAASTDGKLLSRLIGHAATLAELEAILQPCWPVVTAGHAAEALQQLMRLQQTGSSSTKARQGCGPQHQHVSTLAVQLLHHAVAPLARPAAAAPAGSRSVTTSGQADVAAVGLTGCQAAAVLRALVALELQVDQQQLRTLLQQLLQLIEADALQLTGSALVDLLSGVHGLLLQQQQIHQPPPSQLQTAMQQDRVAPQQASAARPELALQGLRQQQQQSHLQVQPQPQHQHEATPTASSVLGFDETRQLMQQRRMLLLRQQQQEEELQQQQQQQQQRQQQAASAAISITEQHRRWQHLQVFSALTSILARCCCDQNSKVRQAGLLPHHLAAILRALHASKYVPGGDVLQQLLAAADLDSSIPSCSSPSGEGTIIQKQQRIRLKPGDAAAVLWHLAQLSDLQQQHSDLQQQRQLVVVPHRQHNPRASSRDSGGVAPSNWPVLSTLHTTPGLPVLLGAVVGKQHQLVTHGSTIFHPAVTDLDKSSAADVHTLCVALAAVAKVAAAVEAAEVVARSAGAAAGAAGAPVAQQQVARSGEGVGSTPTPAVGLSGLGVTPDHIQHIMDQLLQLAEQQGQQQHMQHRQQAQQQRQWLGKNEAVSALDNAIKLWHHFIQHSQQLKASIVTDQQQPEFHDPQQQASIGPKRQQRRFREQQYMTQWIQRYATAVLSQLKVFSPERLTQALLLLSDKTLRLQQLPGYWLKAVEGRVLYHIQVLCGSDSGNGTTEGCSSSSSKPRPDAAAKLLYSWVSLLMQLQGQRRTVYCSAAAAGGGSTRSNRSAVAGVSRVFSEQAAAALQQHLVHLDTASLASAAYAVANLGLSDPGPWLQQLLPAVTAAVSSAMAGTSSRRRSSSGGSSSTGQLAAGAMLAIPLPAAAAYGVPAAVAATVPATNSTAAASSTTAATATAVHYASTGSPASVSLTPQALLQLLQSLLLLRCRAPIPLLQQALALAQRDMLAVAKGSVLVGLLLVLVQLRVRPSTGWMRAILLRTQGKLRMLSFDELTQLCWCLAQMGVVPPQQWQDDYADTAAVHVIAWKKEQQHRRLQQKEQDGQPHAVNLGTAAVLSPGSSSSSSSTSSSSRGRGSTGDSGSSLAAATAHAAAAKPPADIVHTWQLMVMRWAFACWGYRPGHAVGKLQYRLLRELNALAWGVHAQQLQWQDGLQKQQQGVTLSSKQQQKLETLTLARKVRKQRHLQLQLLRYYRRRRMSTSWQVAAAATKEAANRWIKKHGAVSDALYSTSSRPPSKQQGQRMQEQRPQSSGNQHDQRAQGQQPQQRLRGWRQLLRRQQLGNARSRRNAERLLERLMELRAAAVWPRQWGLVALEPQPADQ